LEIFSHHARDNNTVRYCPWYGKLDKKEGLAYKFILFMPKSNIEQIIYMDSIKELAHTQLANSQSPKYFFLVLLVDISAVVYFL
jgi:hypothetical protein